MKWRAVLLILSLLIGLIAIVYTYSASSVYLKCEGLIYKSGEPGPSTLYASLTRYRWWVGLWSEGSEGDLWVEFEDGHTQYFSSMGDGLGSWFIYENLKKSDMRGMLSKLSLKLRLMTDRGQFEGDCNLVPKEIG